MQAHIMQEHATIAAQEQPQPAVSQQQAGGGGSMVSMAQLALPPDQPTAKTTQLMQISQISARKTWQLNTERKQAPRCSGGRS